MPMPEDPAAAMTIADEVSDVTPAFETSFRVMNEGGTLKFVRVYHSVPAGIHLGENELLPRDDKDPRIFDQDGDGKPGVTVLASAPRGRAARLTPPARAARSSRSMSVISAEGRRAPRARSGVEPRTALRG